MKKTFTMLLAVLSLIVYAQENEEYALPQWFLNPAEHTYVGVSQPNGNVQEAINTALLHYLISSNFAGKQVIRSSSLSSSKKEESMVETLISFDTTLHYSIDEIISTPHNEYVCRISNRPHLSRRIVVKEMEELSFFETADIKDDQWELNVQCFFEDASGKSAMFIEYMNKQHNSEEQHQFSSEYKHLNGYQLTYHNAERPSIAEQLILNYLDLLKKGFNVSEQQNDMEISAEQLQNAYHTATHIRGFSYRDGQLFIQP